MKYATLIRRAWKVTRKSNRLVWFLMFPAFAQMVFFGLRIAWQTYRYGVEFGYATEEYNMAGLFSVFRVISERNLTSIVIMFIILVIAFQYLFMPLVDGTLYFAIKQKYQAPKAYLSLRQKMLQSTGTFFQLFEMRAVMLTFSPAGAVLWTASFYRYFHDSFWQVLKPFMIFYIILSLLVSFFTIYAPFFLLYNGETFKDSLRKSAGLVFVYLAQTGALFLLVLLLNLRILVNALLLLGIPIGLVFLLGDWGAFGMFLIVTIGVAILTVISYLNAMLDVFITSIWARAFMAFESAQKKAE